MRVTNTTVAARPPGIIDSLTAGFETINRRFWMIVIPVLLDLYLWVGPHLSVGPLLQQLEGADPTGLPITPLLRDATDGFDLSTLLVLQVNSLARVIPPEVSLVPGGRMTVTIDSWNLLALLAGAFSLLGVLIVALYYAPIGQAVRDGRVEWRRLPGQWLRYWLRLVLLGIVLAVLVSILGIPLVAALVITGSAGSTPFVLAATLAQVVLLWTGIYLFFATDAVVVSDFGTLRAMRASFDVVRGNFWSSLGLIATTYIISAGLPIVWRLIAANPAGALGAIVANAYISTGLVAASMVFYKNRWNRLKGGPERNNPGRTP